MESGERWMKDKANGSLCVYVRVCMARSNRAAVHPDALSKKIASHYFFPHLVFSKFNNLVIPFLAINSLMR